MQQFLKRCFKRKYISEQLNVHNLLKSSNISIFNKVKKQLNHPLRGILPIAKETSYDFRKRLVVSHWLKRKDLKTVLSID